MMNGFGIACFVLALANMGAAVFYGWRGDIASLLFTVNFALFGGMLQLKVFG